MPSALPGKPPAPPSNVAGGHSESFSRAAQRWMTRLGERLGRSSFRIAAAAAAVNLLLFAAAFALGIPGYETNDDVFMMMIASGQMTGEPSEYLVFSNVLIGQALQSLYEFDDTFNWYSAYLYATHAVALTGLLFALLWHRLSRFALIAFLLVFIGFELRLLLAVQFTSTAVIAGTCGVLLTFCAATSSGRWSYIAPLLGGGLIVLSAMIREQSFYLAALLMFPLAAHEIWRLRSWRIPASLALSAAVAFAAITYNQQLYARAPEWKQYLQYNALRSRLHDYPLLEGERHSEIFKEVGWSANDIAMFRIWFFADAEQYSRRNLKKIVDQLAPGETRRNEWSTFLFERLAEARLYLVFTVFNVSLAWFIASGRRLRFVLASLALLVPAAGAMVYLSMLGRLPHHVLLPLIATLNISFFYVATVLRREDVAQNQALHKGFFGYAVKLRFLFLLEATRHDAPETPDLRKVGFLRYESPVSARDLGVALLTLAFVGSAYVTSQRLFELSVENEGHFIELSRTTSSIRQNIVRDDPEALFVVCGGAFPFQWCSPLSNGEELVQLDMIRMGWLTHSPHFNRILENHSISDIHTALYRRDNVYLIAFRRDVSTIERFLEQHHGVDISANTLYTGNFVVVKLAETRAHHGSRQS